MHEIEAPLMFSEIGKVGTHTLLSYLAFEEDDGLLLGCKTVRFQARLHGRKAGWLHGCITPCSSDHTVASLRDRMAAELCGSLTHEYVETAIWPQFAWLRGWVAALPWGCVAAQPYGSIALTEDIPFAFL